jgi:hypothetical protein
MKNQKVPLYAVAAAILVVGLAFAGVPVTTLVIGLAVLGCPLAMLLMMSGMRGDQNGSGPKTDRPQDKDEHHPAAGNP